MKQDTFQFINVPRAEPNKTPLHQRKSEHIEIYQEFTLSQAQQQAERCLDCGNPYCSWKCPLHNYIPRWLTLVAEGQIEAAASLSHQTNPLPEICGRVCPQEKLCEGACTLNDGFGAVTIGHLERFITDAALEGGWKPEPLVTKGMTAGKVAVIGAGPAGLSCAERLARSGVQVRVYDRHPEIGGLLTFGLPSFKLEKDLLVRRRELLEAMGVEFVLNTEVDEAGYQKILSDYDAVFLGLGAQTPLDARLENQQLAGVYQALDYLIASNRDQLGYSEQPAIDLSGQRVLVLGGGDTAMDCVRTAIRQGAVEVRCAYRRDQANMPGSQKEVKHAIEEGAQFLWQRQPLGIECDDKGRLTGVRMAQTELAAPDASGRQSVRQVEGSEHLLEADAVIISFGFIPKLPEFMGQSGLESNAWGGLCLEQGVYPQQSSLAKVFAGGDLTRGADLVVTAVADGLQAAEDIQRFLHQG
ncbi:FAD-dependent oxidoreductase [Dongshaea marina]|uniref:FAD-dependent oxidoreductase n=1 Tax=Dongshaea marina TaxID=2047966 RepID=UPI000D3E8753|nr:FAD-dependent oxidoreductase [Dongshaea marina]